MKRKRVSVPTLRPSLSPEQAATLDAKALRLRESVMFYLKLDFALFASIVTIAALFDLKGARFVHELAGYRTELRILSWLALGGIFLELWTTMYRNGVPGAKALYRAEAELKALTVAWFLLVLGHGAFLAFLFGTMQGVMTVFGGP